MVVPIRIGTGLVALLRNIDFTTDDGMNSFRIGLVIELDSAKEVAMVSHGDGRHFLFGDHLHELLDFAGTVKQGVVSVAMEVNEREFRPCFTAGEVISV